MLQYLIKFSISLAVLFIFYRAVLRPLTFYQCNRFYLLGYSLLSFVIPFIDISSLLPGNSAPRMVNIIPSISYYNFDAANLPATQLSLLQRLTVTDWLLLVFCIGAIIMLVRLLLQYISLRKIRHTAVLLDADAGVRLYETSAVVSPFSFGNAIYFNRRLHTEEELQRIIQHEFVHVKQKHTIDLLMGELLCVVNWFNPFAWMIRYSIRQNLEFIADNNVVSNGLDKKEYQYLLLKVVGVPQYSIANNFNFSNLKKRIAMMNKMKSAKLHLTKFLFVLPLLVVLLLAFRNKISNDKETFVFTGIVYDAKTAQPLAGVLINEQYSRLATATDAKGFFKLKMPLGADSIFKLNCNFLLPGYVNKDGQNLSFSRSKVKTYANLVFVGMRQQNNASYDGLTVSTHYQIPVTDENQFIADPDYSFVQDKFIAYQNSKQLSDKVDLLIKDSKKPIWIIDGAAYAIGNGSRAWFNKDENVSVSSFKVWVDGKVMSMDEANALVNRFEVSEVAACFSEYAQKKFNVNSNLLVLYWKTKPGPDKNHQDTMPPPPPPVKLDFAPTDQPLLPVKLDFAPADQPLLPVKIDFAAASPQVPAIIDNLPAGVSGIVTTSNIDKKTGTETNTATVTLKNGKKETYHLNKPDEKEKFTEKYGKQPKIRFDAVPAPPAVLKHWFNLTDTTKKPLFIVDGIEQPQNFAVNSIDAAKISSVNVIKGQSAVAVYGEKAASGAVLITMKKPSDAMSNTQQPSVLTVRRTDPNNVSIPAMMEELSLKMYKYKAQPAGTIEIKAKQDTGYFPKDVLVIIDGKEIPNGSKISDYVQPADIESMTVVTDKTATDRYGDKGKNGVIELILKNKNQPDKKTSLQQPAAFFHSSGIDKMQADSVVTMRTGNKIGFIEMVFNLKANSIRYTPADALVLLDGKPLPEYARIYDYVARNEIHEITASIDKSVTDKYGEKGKHGVIEIESKDNKEKKNGISKTINPAVLNFGALSVAGKMVSEANKNTIDGTFTIQSKTISLGAFNVPQGSVIVRAADITLKEGIDYSVDYRLGTVKIINQAIVNAGVPVKVKLIPVQVNTTATWRKQHEFLTGNIITAMAGR